MKGMISLALCAALLVGSALAEDRPNVLLIAIDDLRTDLGAYGHPTAVTPNLDAFAESGLLFENAITQQAVCAPSRAALMLGLRPDTTGIQTLKQPVSETVPDAVSVAKLFKRAGYETIQVGKIYHHKEDDADAWSKPAFSTMQEVRRARRKAGDKLAAKRVADPSELPDVQNVERAIGELRRLAEGDDPFFLAFGVHKPHLPFYAPDLAWELYAEEDVPEPVSREPQAGAPDWALVAYEVNAYHDTPPKGQPIPEETADRLRHGYLAAVSFADGVVGTLLAEVEALGLEDDTIVVIWSDHGFKLGDYDAWAKHSNVELDIHIPLMIRVPGQTKAGSRSAAMVETVDVYPTLAELAGLEAPTDLEGLSMMPLLKRPGRRWKEAAFAQYDRGGARNKREGDTVRTERFRYTLWTDGNTGEVLARELYDHEADPNELRNVADDEKYAKELARLDALLEAGPDAVKDKVRR